MSDVVHVIEHDAKACRFFFEGPKGDAELTYEWCGDQTVNFTHTYVPFSLRGKGLADLLVEKGLAWARGAGLELTTCCWFVEKYLDAESEA